MAVFMSLSVEELRWVTTKTGVRKAVRYRAIHTFSKRAPLACGLSMCAVSQTIHLRATPYRAVENAISGGPCPTFGDPGFSLFTYRATRRTVRLVFFPGNIDALPAEEASIQ